MGKKTANSIVARSDFEFLGFLARLGHCILHGEWVGEGRGATYIKVGGKQWVVTSAPPQVQSREANSKILQNGKCAFVTSNLNSNKITNLRS